MLYGEVPSSGGFTVRVHNPPKEALLRLPTSEEMIAYQDAQKMVRRSLGRGQWMTDPVPNEKADLDLFQKLRVDKDGAEWDAAEARKALLRFTQVSVAESQRDGDQYVVTLQTPFGLTVHRVGIPTEKQLSTFRPMVSKDLRHGNEELRYRVQSGIELYDAVKRGSEGYAAGVDVPAHHKFAVANELAQAMEEMFEGFDPNL